MMNLEASVNSFSIDWLSPDLVGVEVGSDDDVLRSDFPHDSILILKHERFLVTPLLKTSEHELLVFL